MMSMQSLRHSPSLLALTVGAVYLLGFGVPSALAQLDSSDEDRAKNLIVMVEDKLDGLDNFGAGIIVSVASNRIYIATANHVVRSRNGQSAVDIFVEFHFLPGRRIAAEVLDDTFDADLAVLEVNLTGAGISTDSIHFDILGDDRMLQRGDDVYHVGNPSGNNWWVNVQADNVSRKTLSAVRFQTTAIAPGSSGGGLFNGRGELVGMVITDRPPEAQAVPISVVIEELRSSRYPVDLIPVQGLVASEGVVAEVPVATGDRDRRTSYRITGGPGAVLGEVRSTSGSNWISLASDDDISNPASFMIARTYGNGRVLAAGHSGLFTNVLENTGFLLAAVEWLAASTSGTVLVATGHGEVFGRAQSADLRRALAGEGYQPDLAPGALTHNILQRTRVLVLGNAPGTISSEEIDAVQRFVANGGGLLVAGLGWAWLSYGDGSRGVAPDRYPLDEYPMNQLMAPFGMEWTREYLTISEVEAESPVVVASTNFPLR